MPNLTTFFKTHLCTLGFIMGLTALSPLCFAQARPQMNLPRVEIAAGIYRIDAQVASTARQLQTGLMSRQNMPENEGMLFIFPEPQTQCFWMKNTLMPLSAAFIADDGTIINIADMEPLSLEAHCSLQPVRFVLEMHQGWFEQRGFNEGFRLRGEPFQPSGNAESTPAAPVPSATPSITTP